ncbi:MAG: excinuclease ABC subunit UvrB [Candidatus Omnitrophica bacterium]|nr:excinuclease ABC subunit UvrB [Candidatus Omnitrophota bacterium]
MPIFHLISDYKPQGDQPAAIGKLVNAISAGKRFQTLLGVTGSGKTFTMAHVIEKIAKPTLVISHNKTLAAQLYTEFKDFFPENAVEYFVSYYDYYQPEAYIPQTDVYIEKDASINDNIDRLRLSATSSLMSRQDVIVVASVSCIYGLGSPEEYGEMLFTASAGERMSRDEALKKLIDIYYERNDYDFKRGKFRVRGDTVEIFPAYRQTAFRMEFAFDTIERIREVNPLTGDVITDHGKITVYPAKHFVTTPAKMEAAIKRIEEELEGQLAKFREEGKLLEAERLSSRTKYDIEMMREVGYCNGIENYSRPIAGRPAGSRPYCLLDYFPDDFLCVIDESHVTLPQVRGMYNGDRARKETLVEYGFRLPSALDNRPLKFDEFMELVKQIVFVSATPTPYEVGLSQGVVEQFIRPTGIIDPPVTVRPTRGQITDLIEEVKKRAGLKERVLVTTLTKRLAEDLTRYLQDLGINVKYIHSEIGAIERVEILRDLRLKKFDCLVGINLLREGLDLPEVSLVAVLDADKEGFLRSVTSLIQVAGRAARNVNGVVIMYADTMTESMKKAIDEMNRRRAFQSDYNEKHNITPTTVKKAIREGIEMFKKAQDVVADAAGETHDEFDAMTVLSDLEEEMKEAARNLAFEKAIELREKIRVLKKQLGI